MREEAFGKVLKGVARLCGLDPARMSPELAESMAGWIEQRVRQAWESFPWPELMRVEERFYAALYDEDATYAEGDIVRAMDEDANVSPGCVHPCVYYTLVDATEQDSTAPGENAEVWKTTSPERFIDLEQAEGFGIAAAKPTPMGEVFGVYRRNPRRFKNPGELSFTLSGDGIHLDQCAPSPVFVEFRLRPYEFTTTAWSATANYSAGDMVYDHGECHVAVGAVSPVSFLTVTGTARTFEFALAGTYYATEREMNGSPVYQTRDSNLIIYRTSDGWATGVIDLFNEILSPPGDVQDGEVAYFFNTTGSADPSSSVATWELLATPGTPASGTLTVVLTTAGTNPASDTTHWTRIRVPHVLADYARRAARADFLADDGQDEKAFAQERRAADWIEEQFLAATVQQRQTAHYSVNR